MIIKSMSRKHPTFSQLIDYMEDGRQDKDFTITHNLFEDDPEIIKDKFKKNASFFKKQKNSVFMYHEVISITKSKQLSDKEHKEILRKIIREYIEKRASNNLVYGVLHEDKKDNFHYHLLISSNTIQAKKNLRLSKSEFSTIKKELEVSVLSKFPELQQSVVMNKPAHEKISHREYASTRRTGKNSKRDEVKQRLKNVFLQSKDKQDFFENLEKENIEIYVRGKTTGIIDKETGKKHRLKTLGMLEDFQKISHMIVSMEETKKESSSRKEEIKENRTPYKEKVSVKNNSYRPENSGTRKEGSREEKNNGNNQKEERTQQNNDSLTEEEIEIQKRKEILRESRKSDYNNEFSKTRNR